MLIRWFTRVTFFLSLKFSICVCHFGVDLLILPVTLFRDNIEIILHVQNTVDPLIQPVTFLPDWKISICVCHFGVDWLIWPVTLPRDKIEIIQHVQNTVDPMIQPVTFLLDWKFSICVCHFGVDLAGNSIQRKYRNYTICAKPCWSVDPAW